MSTAELHAPASTRLLLDWRLAAVIAAAAVFGAVGFGAAALVIVSLAVGMPLVWLRVLARPERALPIYIAGLPVYVMGLVILYGVFGLPAPVLRVVQLWKELLLLTVLAGLVLRARVMPRFGGFVPVDAIVVALVALNLLYGFFPFGDAPLVARAGAARANVIFAALYLVGRLTSSTPVEAERAVRLLALLATATVTAVLIERLFLPDDWPLRLGYSRFLMDFYGGVAVHSPDELPWTFYTDAKIFRRPSAFFANPLDMAAGCLLLAGTSLTCYMRAREEGSRSRWWLLLTLAVCVTLIASLARMATVALPIVLAAVAWARGRRRLAGLVGVGFVLGLTSAVLVSGPLIREYLARTLVFENASSVGHVEEWIEAARSLVSHPFGRGLGASGAVAARSSGAGIGGENQYLIYGVELGWLGMLLYILLLGMAVLHSARALHRHHHPLFGTALAASLALVVLGLTSEIGSYLFVVYVGWWLIGVSVSAEAPLTRGLPRRAIRA